MYKLFGYGFHRSNEKMKLYYQIDTNLIVQYPYTPQ